MRYDDVGLTTATGDNLRGLAGARLSKRRIKDLGNARLVASEFGTSLADEGPQTADFCGVVRRRSDSALSHAAHHRRALFWRKAGPTRSCRTVLHFSWVHSRDSVDAGDDCAREHVHDGSSGFARRLGLNGDVTAAPAHVVVDTEASGERAAGEEQRNGDGDEVFHGKRMLSS